MKRLARKGRRRLLELISEEDENSARAIPCDEVADWTAPAFGEPSCAFDFAECLPRDPNNGSRILFKNELSAMASASSFD